MAQFRYIRKVTPLARRKLAIEWNDGSTSQKDMSDLIRNRAVFRPLTDPGMFAKVTVINNGRAIQWTDEIDYCADALWIETRSQAESPQKTRQRLAG